MLISCPQCRFVMDVDEAEWARVSCGGCGVLLEVPSPEQPARRTLLPVPIGSRQPVPTKPPPIKVTLDGSAGEKRGRRLPMLTRTAAVVECPWCRWELRVEDDLFNEPLTCPRCDQDFEV